MLSQGRTLKGLVISTLLLCAGRPAAAYTALHPKVAGDGITTLTLSWNNAAGPFVGALSTDPTFATAFASGTLSGNTTTYTGLSNAPYYFRIKIKAEDDNAYTGSVPTNQITIPNTVAAPSAPYFNSFSFRAASSATAVAGLNWDTSGNPDWTTYELQYAEDAGFTTGAQTVSYQIPPVSVGGLKANTIYYFEVRARAFGGDYNPPAGYVGPVSSSTLAMDISGLEETTDETSATVAWTPVSSGVQAMNSEGYRLLWSPLEAMGAPTTISIPSAATSSATISSLARNTVYYYSVGALNWDDVANMADVRSFSTLAAKPAPRLISVGAGAASLGWPAFPASPQAASASGYRLEASVSPAFADGTVLSSTTYDLLASTLSMLTLDFNTTYYFRTASLNTDENPNYDTLGLSSVTLSQPVSEALTLTVADPQTLTVNFTPLPAAPQAFSCEGYRLEVSSSPFGSGGTVKFSSTTASQTYQLSVSGLRPNLLYYMRLGTLNLQGTPNYTDLAATRTPIPVTFSSATLAGVWQTTATITFVAAPEGPDGYVAEASTYPYFDVISTRAVTNNPAASSLAISNLAANTKFYFRAGVLFNGTTVYVNTAPSHGYTLPKTLTGANISAVFSSSVTLSWNPILSTEADHFQLEASTSAGFIPVLFSSTSDTSVTNLPVYGLAYNTSYYFRVGAVNAEGGSSYATINTSTSTLANLPTDDGFDSTPSNITVRWLPNGNPQPNTRYLVEISSYSNFTPLTDSSTTVLSSATFSGLISNIVYWTRVTAINQLNRRIPAVNFSPMATAAADPTAEDPFYSDIGVTSMTVKWLGNNPNGTRYQAWISTGSDFTAILSSETDKCLANNCSATFYGLMSNASYYMEVAALNLISTPTVRQASAGVALTLPATAYFSPVTTQTFTSPLIDGFSVHWGANGNSALTSYKVQAATDPAFSVISSTAYATGTTSCIFSGLSMDTTYWVRIYTLGQGGASVHVDTGTATTISHFQSSVVAQQDNTISLATSYGNISLFFPKGSIGSSIYSLNLSPKSSFVAAKSAVSELHPTNVGIAVTYFPTTLILNAITITLPYNNAALPAGMDRTKLVLALFDETNQLWVPLPSVSDTANHRVIAQTWHLSTFQLMEGVSQTGLGEVKIYPNPYKPNSAFNVMHFTNMTAYAKVRIYTFLGELVRELKADVNGMTSWDGLNSSGEKTASGIYIAFIQTHDKKSNKSYKLAIER